MLWRLENVIQHYAWGSRRALTDLYGVPNPGHEPMAELWMGAHPKAPSRLPGRGGESLDRYISANQRDALGERGEAESVLPFLFKILCAETPLSIQAHPSRDQARAGFAREDAAGIDRAAPDRNYRDDNHKPELICAITPFWALRGFRPVAEIQEELSAVELREADAGLDPPADEGDLGRFFRSMLELPEDERRELIAGAVALARGRWDGGREIPEPDNPLARYFWVLRVAQEYPGDVGILSPLVLNTIALRPGEATYQPAGVLHAYLHGTGAELMANSDNVLRGGMTPKHIDPDELLAVGVFRSEQRTILSGSGEDLVTYETPFAEFSFSRLLAAEGRSTSLPTGSPQILFCHRGHLNLRTEAGDELVLAAGEAAFVDAATAPVAVRGAGELFVARVP